MLGSVGACWKSAAKTVVTRQLATRQQLEQESGFSCGGVSRFSRMPEMRRGIGFAAEA
jgi:hypothetical protein